MIDRTVRFIPARASEDLCVFITEDRIQIYGHSYEPEHMESVIDELKVKQAAYAEWKRCFSKPTATPAAIPKEGE